MWIKVLQQGRKILLVKIGLLEQSWNMMLRFFNGSLDGNNNIEKWR